MLISLLLLLNTALPDVDGGALFLAGDQSERTGLYENAARLFLQCAQESEILRPYALSRAAINYHAAGQSEHAGQIFEQVLKDHPEGPWIRLTWKRLGDMYYKQGQAVKARSYYNKVLDGLKPLPWFLDNLAWNNADYALLLPGHENEGYEWFRHIVETTIFFNPRQDAAQRLLKSSNPEDRAWGIFGYIRCSKLREAREALDKEVVRLQQTSGAELSLSSLDSILAKAQTDLPGTQKTLDPLVQANKGNFWMQIWLMLAAREQAGGKRYAAAEMLAQLLSQYFTEGRDAGDVYWWLSEKYEALPDKEGAKRMYRQLAERHPGHVRAPRSLLYLANHARDEGKTEEAYKLYDRLGAAFPRERLAAEGYFNAAQMADNVKDAKRERAYLEKSAAVGPGHFYAHRAQELLRTKYKIMPDGVKPLKVNGSDSFLLPMPLTLETHDKMEFLIEHAPVLQRLRFFGMHGLEEGEWEALECILACPESLEKLWFPAIAEAGFMHTMSQFMYDRNWGVRDGLPTSARLRIEYPLAYWDHVCAVSKELDVDPYLVLAIGRQESTFRAGITSSAGATGVLQLMPATASWLAKVDDRIKPEHVQNLKSPINSIRLGAVYLERMLKRNLRNPVFDRPIFSGYFRVLLAQDRIQAWDTGHSQQFLRIG